jgi:predicted phage gp36 major capsid-like protein
MGPLPNVFNIKEKTHGVLAIKAEKKNNREGGEKREDATEKRKEKTEGERRELKRKKQGEKTRKTEKKTERIRGERKKTEGKQTERKQRTQRHCHLRLLKTRYVRCSSHFLHNKMMLVSM